MFVKLHPATAAHWEEQLRDSACDYALSQTFAFGEAIAQAYPEYAYAPQRAEFDDGTQALWPLMKLNSKLKFLRQFEAMPPALNGTPVVLRGTLTGQHMAALLEALRADRLQLNGGILDNPPHAAGMAEQWPGEVSALSTHVLDLRGGWDSVWSQAFNDKVRNQCRTAWKKGVEVRVAREAAEFDTYYEIYADSTRRWGYATPPYPRALFQALAQLNGRGVELKLGCVDGQPIAGIILLRGRRSTLYWSGAMLKDFSKYSANNGLLEVAIREECERGAVNFDFGASGELDSVRKFKEQFGAVPAPYQSFSLQSARYQLTTRARFALGRLRARPQLTETQQT
jgi:CelD/BcsL family acetyltransferase involved in cellulose biosynthesis